MLKKLLACVRNCFINDRIAGVTVCGCCQSKRLCKLVVKSMFEHPHDWTVKDEVWPSSGQIINSVYKNKAFDMIVFKSNYEGFEFRSNGESFRPGFRFQILLRLATRHVRATHLHRQVFGW